MIEVEERPYTVFEVAEMVKVNEATVRGWIDRGELQTLSLPGRLVKIPASEVRRILTPTNGAA